MAEMISPVDLDRLETLDWGERNFGSLVTNRQFTRRSMLRLVDRGLAKSVGPVELCDDDGFMLDSGRMAEGFVLTEAGRAMLEQGRAEWEAELNRTLTPDDR